MFEEYYDDEDEEWKFRDTVLKDDKVLFKNFGVKLKFINTIIQFLPFNLFRCFISYA